MKSGVLAVCALTSLLFSGQPAVAVDYYVDPATGSMSNPGTSTSPWSTLEAVFTANKTFVAGDVIHLRSGYHGVPRVKGINTGTVTIQPDTGATPTLRRLRVDSAAHWFITGLDICPEHTAPGSYEVTYNLVDIFGSATYISFIGNKVRNAFSIAGWTAADWTARVAKRSAISSAGPNTVIQNNILENVSFAITISKTGTNSVVSENSITNFMNDGLRALASDCVFENNIVRNNYVQDANHDDFFQSWSTDAQGVVGQGTVSNVIVRGNIFVSQTDPNQPLHARPQGIGCFDGLFENWVVENNLVVLAGTSHGISLYGAINCRLVNNTVVVNPLAQAYSTSFQPSVRFFQHKKFSAAGYEYIPAASGNLIRNNLVTRTASLPSGAGTVDFNLTMVSNYTDYFVDYNGLNFALKPGAPAIDAGSNVNAPMVDIDGVARIVPFDVGAYEYVDLSGPLAYEPFTYAPTLNVNTALDSLDDTGFLGTTWTGTNDIITPGLNYPGLNVLGNALRFTANVGAVRSIDMSVFPVEYTQVDSDSVTRLGKAGSTLWLSFLIRADDADIDSIKHAGLNLNGAASGGIVKLRIGDVGTNTNWSIIKGTTVGGGDVPIITGGTVLVVAKVTFVAGTKNDEVDLFINPALGGFEPTVPSAILRGLDVGTFDRLEVKGTRTSTIDEVALATSWNDL